MNPKVHWADVLEIARKEEVAATLEVQLLDGIDSGCLIVVLRMRRFLPQVAL